MATGVESSVTAVVKKAGVGRVLEAAGVLVFVAGVVQLLHHGAIAACVLGGIGAFFAGKRLRAAG